LFPPSESKEKKIMKYMLLFYANPAEAPQYTPEQQQAAAQEWLALLKETKTEGVFVSTGGISPASNTTTVRVRDGKTLIADGPFAETHEQLGGYFLLDCEHLDEAIRWAAKIPAAKYGSVEIRPLWGQE
jgi:hypothetical protein